MLADVLVAVVAEPSSHSVRGLRDTARLAIYIFWSMISAFYHIRDCTILYCTVVLLYCIFLQDVNCRTCCVFLCAVYMLYALYARYVVIVVLLLLLV